MKISGIHRIGYQYNAVVDLNPHTLRLRPQESVVQKINRFELIIDPIPRGISWIRDAQQNECAAVWFDQPSDRVLIETRWEVETRLANPFQFLLSADVLPYTLPADTKQILAPELEIEASEVVRDLAREFLKCANTPQAYVQYANQWICNNIQMEIRIEEGTRKPAETLYLRRGACRDMAWLMIQLCRLQGLPATFVSGYCFHGSNHTMHDLHAWVDVWIPFGGWRGYDPSIGLAVSDRHIALCRAPYPGSTLPIEGSFRGNAAARMNYQVEIYGV